MKINKKHFRKIVIILIFALVISFVYYLFFFEPYYKGSISSERTLLIAHRGFGNYAPDNSFSAVEKAISYGLDGVDLDAQWTLDEELVIFHDPTLERLTDGTGRVKDKTLTELKNFDIGYKFHENYTGERILTLGEMIRKVDKRTLLIIELKSGKIKSEGIEEKAIKEIQENNAYDNVYLSSFNPFIIYRIEKLDSKVNTVFIFRDIEPYDPTQFANIPFVLKKEPFRRAIRKMIRPDFLSLEITVHEDTIKNLQQRGYPIFLWPPNNKEEIKDSLNKKSFGIISDEPMLMLNLSEGKKWIN